MSSRGSTASTGNGGGGGDGNSGYFNRNLTSLGLGYAIAIALGFLVLLSTILLASYVCFRARSRSLSRNRARPRLRSPNTGTADSSNGIILPRIIFVAEDDDGGRDEESVVGLDQMVINSYPKFPFCKSRDCESGDSMCSICLCDYKDGEMLRMMPDCRHFFHLYCIDAWLRLNASCPVCRNSPLPTPLSTPLSELVPLSQYPGDRRR
ncbi:RING-H2 finger protein ATL68-like [Macadamia integrifolia]|uniref:RING-H2 finger protein ATL68-like n=1 Tax=Macadamia integrifolia TaxID=60698 RepID=UPI001C4EAFE2|nr:RING-H2 finger protein ATL68-like [Macadamia integrifolia]